MSAIAAAAGQRPGIEPGGRDAHHANAFTTNAAGKVAAAESRASRRTRVPPPAIVRPDARSRAHAAEPNQAPSGLATTARTKRPRAACPKASVPPHPRHGAPVRARKEHTFAEGECASPCALRAAATDPSPRESSARHTTKII